MDDDTELRLQAMQLALGTSVNGEPPAEVVARAEAYLAFLKGTNNG